MRALAAAALGCLLAGCAARGGGGAAPATDAPGTPSMMPPAAGASATSTSPATAPDRDRVRAAEEARVGALRVLRARGVAEVRWRDASGDHFEQGDADLRWCDGRGIAVSVSKLGERFGWFGSDGVRWWRFDTKATPTRAVVGTVADGGGAGAGGVPSPRLLGLRALRPAAAGAVVLRDGRAWVELEPEAGGRTEAAFDPRTLEPVAVRTVTSTGAVLDAAFEGLFAVETAGAAPGAWPRIPRRVRLRVAGAEGGAATDLMLAFDSAAADAGAADREGLYDFARLRELLKPEVVEDAP
jgi:hypothetical protein